MKIEKGNNNDEFIANLGEVIDADAYCVTGFCRHLEIHVLERSFIRCHSNNVHSIFMFFCSVEVHRQQIICVRLKYKSYKGSFSIPQHLVSNIMLLTNSRGMNFLEMSELTE